MKCINSGPTRAALCAAIDFCHATYVFIDCSKEFRMSSPVVLNLFHSILPFRNS